ncbi:MAG: metallophosphatase family protein [Gammaproteobacteria bacterium]|nr:metallophosphatase family protein [Gammaproteobacteria bacterium]
MKFSGAHKLRVGIVSDTHGEIDFRIVEILNECDLVIHAGDIGNSEVLSLLQPKSGNLVAVRGNNDIPKKWPRSDHAVLNNLSDSEVVSLPGGDIAIEHGHRIWDTKNYHKRLRVKYARAKMIVYGHTHIRLIERKQKPWVVNPGAAGRSRTFGGPSCLVLNATASSWRLREFCFALHARKNAA